MLKIRKAQGSSFLSLKKKIAFLVSESCGAQLLANKLIIEGLKAEGGTSTEEILCQIYATAWFSNNFFPVLFHDFIIIQILSLPEDPCTNSIPLFLLGFKLVAKRFRVMTSQVEGTGAEEGHCCRENFGSFGNVGIRIVQGLVIRIWVEKDFLGGFLFAPVLVSVSF